MKTIGMGLAILAAIAVTALAFILLLQQREVHQLQPSNQVLTDSIKLCEQENPDYNASLECQKAIDQKYAGMKCTFSFGNRVDLPLGSCVVCEIECK